MSTHPEVLNPAEEPYSFEEPSSPPREPLPRATPLSNPRRFAEEQMRGLVRQVFCPGWPRPARQVVFAGIDRDCDVASICMQAGYALSDQVGASICVVEANLYDAEVQIDSDKSSIGRSRERNDFGSLRSNARQVTQNLWHISSELLMDERHGLQTAWLKSRFAELRLEFDYTIVHGPPLALYSEAVILGNVCEGVILVLDADETRKVTALKIKETLLAANIRLLGAVLNGRTFPIPENIYKRV